MIDLIGDVGDVVCIAYLICLVPLVIFFDAICNQVQDIYLLTLRIREMEKER